jgi:Putative zinc-finger
MSIDTSLLGAYVDGELTPDEIAEVEAHLADSAEARETVDRLRSMNGLLAAAYDEPLRAPLPLALRASLSRRAPPRSLRSWWPVAGGMALAASIALAVGLFVGGNRTGPTDSPVAAGRLAYSSPLHALFETRTDGSQTDLGQGEAMLVATFFDDQGRPCREVEISQADLQSRTRAVACRRNDAWMLEVAVTRPDPRPETRSEYVPASGVGEEVVGAALDALGAGPVLGPAEVDNLIEGGWRSR